MDMPILTGFVFGRLWAERRNVASPDAWNRAGALMAVGARTNPALGLVLANEAITDAPKKLQDDEGGDDFDFGGDGGDGGQDGGRRDPTTGDVRRAFIDAADSLRSASEVIIERGGINTITLDSELQGSAVRAAEAVRAAADAVREAAEAQARSASQAMEMLGKKGSAKNPPAGRGAAE
jgi:hypothetical protein